MNHAYWAFVAIPSSCGPTLLAHAPGEVSPLIRVKAFTALVLLLVILLFLIVFNRLMARWARGAGNKAATRGKRTSPPPYNPDSDDWTRRRLIDDDFSDDDD